MTKKVVDYFWREITGLIRVVEQSKEVREGKMDFLEIVMPNGKKIRECTAAEIREVGKAFKGFGTSIEECASLGIDVRDKKGPVAITKRGADLLRQYGYEQDDAGNWHPKA